MLASIYDTMPNLVCEYVDNILQTILAIVLSVNIILRNTS